MRIVPINLSRSNAHRLPIQRRAAPSGKPLPVKSQRPWQEERGVGCSGQRRDDCPHSPSLPCAYLGIMSGEKAKLKCFNGIMALEAAMLDQIAEPSWLGELFS